MTWEVIKLTTKLANNIDGCKVKIKDGFIIEECKGKIKTICIPGTRSKNGGFNVFGNGGNAGYGYPDIECFSISKINEKIKKSKLKIRI
jgi:hypothetical protein